MFAVHMLISDSNSIRAVITNLQSDWYDWEGGDDFLGDILDFTNVEESRVEAGYQFKEVCSYIASEGATAVGDVPVHWVTKPGDDELQLLYMAVRLFPSCRPCRTRGVNPGTLFSTAMSPAPRLFTRTARLLSKCPRRHVGG